MTFLPRKKPTENSRVHTNIHLHSASEKQTLQHKESEKGNETTAWTSTTQAQKMLTAGHKEQHKKIILLLIGQ